MAIVLWNIITWRRDIIQHMLSFIMEPTINLKVVTPTQWAIIIEYLIHQTIPIVYIIPYYG